MRIGHGYDVHKCAPDRKLILCGVEIPSEFGLDGHSDADVAAHALMDALLGAAALGDIGRHFPDTDMSYKNADSILLLKLVVALLEADDYHVVNTDITIIAQRPKLADFMHEMVCNIAEALKIPESDVNIKATTEEGLGFTGECRGISAHAVVLIEK